MRDTVVIEGEVNLLNVIEGEFGLLNVIDGEIDKVIYVDGSHAAYTGDYIVTPITTGPIVLETAQKIMTDDVTVLTIPYFETANESGNTVFIGEYDNG